MTPEYRNLPSLSLEDVSLAWEFLVESAQSEDRLLPPPNLRHLSMQEWHLLSFLLNRELELKDRNPLQ